MIKTLNTLDKGGSVLDLTNAETDYMLEVGETATITYTNATSVPLHVATVEGGIYDLNLYGDSIEALTSGYMYLKPNNTDTATNAVTENRIARYGSTVSQGTNSVTSFRFIDGRTISLRFNARTKTEAKVVQWDASGIDSAYFQVMQAASKWSDTTTAWTSLGTLSLGTAQSGKIIIRRIA